MERRISHVHWFMACLLAIAGLLTLALPAAADGIIIPHPPPGRPPIPWRDIPLSIKYHHVDVTIENQVATTRVDQVFVNDAPYSVEGTYIFPLPEDAAISSFDMTIDGKKYEGKLLGREEARAIYEDIVRSQRDPALLEYVGRGAFQASIFPIPAGGERRIELTYAQVLPQQNGLVHYRYPLGTEKFSARPIPDVAINVSIVDRARLRAIYSPSHPVQVARDGDRRATAGYEEHNARPDRDFDLYYSLSQDAIAVNLLSSKPAGEDGFFLLLVTPPLEAEGTQVSKDVVLVLDTSGSMEGTKLEQVRTAARYVLDHLAPGDRFNLVAFSTATRLFAEGPQPLSRRDDARSFLNGLRAAGSTDIQRALLEALAGASTERPTIVIFLTDGLPTAGETNPDRIVDAVTQASTKAVRLFAFGVGYDVDTFLLDQLSSNLRGSSAYVKENQSIDEEISAFYEGVSAPVLVDVNVAFDGVQVEDLYPYPLPDLFAGNQLVVAGRYRQGGTATLKMTGTVNPHSGHETGQAQPLSYGGLQFVERGGNEFIPRLWAQRKIGYLLAQIRLHGAKDELVKEVVDLSTRYGIVTPYTSFLVQEPSQALTDAGRQALSQSLQSTAQPGAVGRGGGAVPGAPELALAPQARSGAGAVQRSEVEKALGDQAYAGAATAPDQVRQVGSKAFLLQDGAWTDTTFDETEMKAEAVAFGSERYFQLLLQHPDLAPYLALGDRVTVVIAGQAYAIGPAGATAAQPGLAAPATLPPPVISAVETPETLSDQPVPLLTPGVLASVTAAPPASATPAVSPIDTPELLVETPTVMLSGTPGPAPTSPPGPAPVTPAPASEGPATPGVCTSAAGTALLALLAAGLPAWLKRRQGL